MLIISVANFALGLFSLSLIKSMPINNPRPLTSEIRLGNLDTRRDITYIDALKKTKAYLNK